MYKTLKELGYCVYHMYMIYKIDLIVFIDLNKMILRENASAIVQNDVTATVYTLQN